MSTNAEHHYPVHCRKCSKCGATVSQDNKIRFHRFPIPRTTNILKATAWATYCWPDQDWSSLESLTALAKKNKVLCGRHFQDSCYTSDGKTHLTKYAVPGEREYVVRTLELLKSKISAPSIVEQVIPGERDNVVKTLEPLKSTISAPAVVEQVIPGERDNVVKTLEPLKSKISAPAVVEQVIPGERENVVRTLEPLKSKISDISAPAGVEQDPLELPMQTTKARKKKVYQIFKPMDNYKLNKLSETEQKLYKICKNKMHAIQRLKKQITKRSKIDRIEKICNDESVKRLFNLNLNHSFTLLLESQLLILRRTKKETRYNLDQKLLALTLYKKSPSTYSLLTKIFLLPCPETLNKMLNKIDMKPGINQQAFAGLKLMAETFTEDDSICSLVFGEMAIRKDLNYNTQTDSVDGFEDHGNTDGLHGRTEDIACSALVFMLCGLTKTWKQPVAFYFLSESMTAYRLSVLIEEVLTECFTIGLNVVATIYDMRAICVKALNLLGATPETPYFTHDGQEIVAIADPPHLLKSLRNAFMAHDIELSVDNPDGNTTKGTAKWDHIRQFYAIDNTNPDFVFAPALTEKHIKPIAKQRKRVQLAAQVFSHTVTVGILAKVATNELPPEAQATAQFLKKFDDLFDALNTNSEELRRGKKYSANMTARSPHLEYFAKMKDFIGQMEFLNSKKVPVSKVGWIQTMTAVERLWENLSELGVESLSTRRLNQDPLENLFSCVRYNSGSNENPTVSQFIAGFKTAVITDLKKCEKNKNCEDDDGILANNLKNFLVRDANVGECITRDQGESDDRSDVFSAEEIEDISSDEQACAYVCGCLLKKINNNCTLCNLVLKSSLGNEENQTGPSDLMTAVESVTATCKSLLTKNLQMEKIRVFTTLILESQCKECFNFLKGCSRHYKTNLDSILDHVFIITLERCIVLKNRDLSDDKTSNKTCLKRKLSTCKKPVDPLTLDHDYHKYLT